MLLGVQVDGLSSLSSVLTRRECITNIIFGTSTLVPFVVSNAASLEDYNPESAETAKRFGRSYFPTLTPPFVNRATYRYSLGRNMWSLEQLLTFQNVTATVRTTVVKLVADDDDSLWVNSPQWPTGEFLHLLDELGTVKHVVLPCNALEHKAPMKAFLQHYPQATVWITPGQYGPFGSCSTTIDSKTTQSMGYRVDGILPIGSLLNNNNNKSEQPPWADEFDARTFYVSLPKNAGPVSEAAFYHKPTKTLITTDSVIYVPDQPPPIFQTYFQSNEAKDDLFWPKTVLQSIFLPLRQAGDGTYPGYQAIQGRLVRAPILRAFTDARAPQEVKEWVKSIQEMGDFDRIVTSHFASPIKSTPLEFANAFSYLNGPTNEPPIICKDWQLLDSLNSFIDDNDLGAPTIYDFKAGCPDTGSP